MLATVSMQPMARPASAMTEANTFTSWQKGMTANTREMARVEVKRAHNDWARLGRGELESAEEPRASLEGPCSLPLLCYQREGNCSQAVDCRQACE